MRNFNPYYAVLKKAFLEPEPVQSENAEIMSELQACVEGINAITQSYCPCKLHRETKDSSYRLVLCGYDDTIQSTLINIKPAGSGYPVLITTFNGERKTAENINTLRSWLITAFSSQTMQNVLEPHVPNRMNHTK